MKTVQVGPVKIEIYDDLKKEFNYPDENQIVFFDLLNQNGDLHPKDVHFSGWAEIIESSLDDDEVALFKDGEYVQNSPIFGIHDSKNAISVEIHNGNSMFNSMFRVYKSPSLYSEEYKKNYALHHRNPKEGPAKIKISPQGQTLAYYVNGNYHNPFGPAIIDCDNSGNCKLEYYINGKHIKSIQYKQR